MDSRQPFKKLRLSSENSKNCNNNQKTSINEDPLNDDFGLWGEELELDDDVMQQIETQGYSQYQMQDSEKNNGHFTFNQENIATIQNTDCINKSLVDGSSSQFPQNNDIPIPEPSISTVSNDVIKLREELLMKTGEVTNLRMEMKSREKEYYNQISEKNDEITQLKRQLAGTQSEIEFQKLEMKSHKSKARLSLNNPKVMLKQSNLNSSFHEKFNFETNKNIQKDVKAFHFSRPTDKGDILYKLLKSILNSDDPDFHSSQNLIKDEDSHGSDLIFEKNEFILYLKSSLLQLCWFSTFEEDRAVYLIKLIVTQSKELLTHFYQKLSCEELNLDTANRKSKFMLNRSKDTSEFIDTQHFLKRTKLFPTEEGIFVRQTITMLAKLLEIEAKVVDMLIEPEQLHVARCSCISRANMNVTGENAVELTISKFPEVNYTEKMEVDESSGSG